MKNFYYYSDQVNNQNNHVIHTMDCKSVPPILNRTLIGLKKNCHDAKVEAISITRKNNFDYCSLCCEKVFNLRNTEITKF